MEEEASLEKAKEAVTRKWADHQGAIHKMVDFQQKHYTTYEDFNDKAMEVACPVAKKYKKLYIDPEGDYKTVWFAYMATHAVNSLVADIISDDDLTDVLRDLPNYVVDEFCLTVIQDVIAEILKYRAIINATPAEFWSWV